jgi:hypothetical protein
MTTDVRVKVKNYEGVETAMQNEVFFVVGRIRYGVTKDTRIGPGHISSAGCDVGVSPGTPESFHEKSCDKDPRRAQARFRSKETRAAAG